MERVPLTQEAVDQMKYPFKLDSSEISMALLAKVLKEYQSGGKTSAQFEEDYGCRLLAAEGGYGITGVKFHNDSYKTGFMLKYNL